MSCRRIIKDVQTVKAGAEAANRRNLDKVRYGFNMLRPSSFQGASEYTKQAHKTNHYK